MPVRPRHPGPVPGQTARPAGWLAVGLLAVALLLGQALGLVHAVVHGAAPGHDASSVHPLTAAKGAAAPGSWGDQPLVHLFDEHDDASSCRLFDQASHADLAPAWALVMSVLSLFAVWVPCPVGPVLPRQGAPFEARGPPPRR